MVRAAPRTPEPTIVAGLAAVRRTARRAAEGAAFRLAGPAGAGLALLGRLIEGSCRVEVRGEARCPAGPAIYVHWHRHVPMLMRHNGRRGRVLLVSRARHIEPMARWAEESGVHVLRGASGEGGAQIRQALAEVVRGGRSIVLAVDGPAGPPFQVKAGCVDLARALAVPIVPLGYRCRRGVRLPLRWDDSLVPLPGSELVFVYGEPVRVGEDDDGLLVRERLRRALDELDEGRTRSR